MTMKKIIQTIMAGGLTVCLLLDLFTPIKAMAAGPATVNLLTAASFSLLSKTGITNTGSHASVITGNIGSSPITAAAINNVFCSEITGTIYGVDAAYVGSGSQACFAGNPPLSNKTLIDNAVLDMGTSYADAAGRPALALDTNLFAGNLGGQTLAPGLYKWTTDVTIPTDVTLSGGASDIWIMQIDGNLNISSGGSVPAGIKVLLAGGAQASNIFWQVGGGTGATLGTYSTFNGNILSATQVVMQTGAVLNGRALASTLITLDANRVSGLGAVTVPVVAPVISGSSIAPLTPAIGISMTATPASLLAGPGTVTYAYTVWNVGQQRALTDIKVIDNHCDPVKYIAGDANMNNKIEPSETWKYSCVATLQETTTDTATATGISDDPYRQTASASAAATVIVSSANTAPQVAAPTATAPALTLPVITPDVAETENPTAVTTPPTVTVPPATASSTPIVPGLPNAGIQPQAANPWEASLSIGLISVMGLAFFIRKKIAITKI